MNMDYYNLIADLNLIQTVHFTPGRSGKTIDKVIIHHNAGDLTCETCWNVWQNRAASAHYQVESSGRISQHVWDENTAWHAGDWDANCSSIGIEHADHGDGFTDECIENGAHLTAAVCRYYDLGEPEWMTNVFPHFHFQATSCPAGLADEYNEVYMRKAKEWYRAMTQPKHEVKEVKNGVYRLMNPSTGFHIFTASHDEAQALSDNGWTDEGTGWTADEGQRVFRVYNPNNGDHLLTKSVDEAIDLLVAGWSFEGVAFNSGQGQAIARLYNPNSGEHFYTACADEAEKLIEAGWKSEGEAFKAE